MPRNTVVKMRVALEPVEAFVIVPGEFATPEEAATEALGLLLANGLDDYVGSGGRLPVALRVSDADVISDAEGPVVWKDFR